MVATRRKARRGRSSTNTEGWDEEDEHGEEKEDGRILGGLVEGLEELEQDADEGEEDDDEEDMVDVLQSQESKLYLADVLMHNMNSSVNWS